MSDLISRQIEELRKYARKWSEWNGFNASMPVLPSTNIRLLYSAADTIEALSRPTGEWIKSDVLPNGWHCSHCDSPVMTDDIDEMLFCPNCGAEMG